MAFASRRSGSFLLLTLSLAAAPACGDRSAEEAQDTSFVLRGTAPLAALLGVGAQLDACAAERVSFWSWLSHYAPADPDGGDAA